MGRGKSKWEGAEGETIVILTGRNRKGRPVELKLGVKSCKLRIKDSSRNMQTALRKFILFIWREEALSIYFEKYILGF